MAMASAPGKSLLVLVTLLLVFVSAAESYDGRHAVAHSALARRSRLGTTRHVHHHRRTATPHRYILAEKSNTTGGGGANKNHTAPSTSSSATSPAPAPPAEPSKRHRSHRHRVRNWIIGFVVGSVAGVISGLVLSVLFRLALNCIRGRYRSRSGVTIFTPKLIRCADHLAFLEKDDGLASLGAVIGRGGCGEVYKAQLPVEREGDEPRFIAIKKIKKHSDNTPNNLSDEESRQLDKWSRQIQSEIRTVRRHGLCLRCLLMLSVLSVLHDRFGHKFAADSLFRVLGGHAGAMSESFTRLVSVSTTAASVWASFPSFEALVVKLCAGVLVF